MTARPKSVRGARLSLVAIVLLVLATTCSSGESNGGEADDGGGERYALLRDEAWTLQEAVDPPADDESAMVERPPVDWYVEYVQTSPNESRLVRLSGHDATFENSQSELEALGFQFVDVVVEGWQAVGGTSVDDASGPALLLLESGDASLLVLSYDVGRDELAALAGRIEAVDIDAWTSAGGVVG